MQSVYSSTYNYDNSLDVTVTGAYNYNDDVNVNFKTNQNSNSNFSQPCLEFDSNRLIIYYQNVRGLNTKTHQFSLAVHSANFDIISLTETWLSSSVYDSEIFGADYNVFRADRSSLNSKKCRGGGIGGYKIVNSK